MKKNVFFSTGNDILQLFKVSAKKLKKKGFMVHTLPLKKVFRQFSGMDIFRDVREEDVIDEYIEIVRFVQVYLYFENIDQFELWHKILLQCKDTNKWLAVKFVI